MTVRVREKQEHKIRELEVEWVSVEGILYNGGAPPVYTLPQAFLSMALWGTLVPSSLLTDLREHFARILKKKKKVV